MSNEKKDQVTRADYEDVIRRDKALLDEKLREVAQLRLSIGLNLEIYKILSTHGEYMDAVQHLGISPRTCLRFRRMTLKALKA